MKPFKRRALLLNLGVGLAVYLPAYVCLSLFFDGWVPLLSTAVWVGYLIGLSVGYGHGMKTEREIIDEVHGDSIRAAVAQHIVRQHEDAPWN